MFQEFFGTSQNLYGISQKLCGTPPKAPVGFDTLRLPSWQAFRADNFGKPPEGGLKPSDYIFFRSVEMTQKCFSLVTGALMAAVLLMAGCSNPLDQQEQNGSVSGRGTVRLSLAGAKGRTLFPDVTGLLYRVEAARIGESLQLIIDEWPGSGTQTLTLAPGTWTITVTGYATEDGIDVSRGTVNDVIIIEDTTAPSLSILLNRLGIPDSGTGTLRYGGLEFNNLIPFPLAIGTLTLERVDGTVG
jgi:hypothetical protein